jgi:transcriptional regulator with XRE-family HTH domain
MTDEEKVFTRKRIGRRIAELRREQKLTQTKLAELAGIQRTHLLRIEAGRYAVTLETIEAIARALGASVDIVD